MWVDNLICYGVMNDFYDRRINVKFELAKFLDIYNDFYK